MAGSSACADAKAHACARAAAVLACCLLAACMLAAVPQMRGTAFAKTVTDQETGKTYEHDELPDGAYKLPVELRQASDTSKASMAGAALDQTADLTVEEGQYRLSLKVGTIDMGSVTGYVSRIDYYPDYELSGKAVKTQGDAIKLWTSTGASDKGPAEAPVLAGDPMKEDAGYIPLALYSEQMPVSPQDAALLLNWADLEVESIEAEPEPEQPADPSVDKSKLKKALSQARAALNRGGKTSAATKALTRAVKQADKVFKNPDATQKQVDAQRKKLAQALSDYKKAKAPADSGKKDDSKKDSDSKKSGNSGPSSGKSGTSGSSSSGSSSSQRALTVADEGYKVGSTYSVPMTFTKAGSDETSMAAQYFGTAAIVKPQSDGTYEVQFTTNRSDYVTSISYNGAALTGIDGSGTERTYTMSVPTVESDSTYRLAMSIKPMQELGTDSVDVDLRLNFSQGTNASTGTAAFASAARSSSPTASGGKTPSTGDTVGKNGLVVAGCAAAALAVCAVARRRMHAAARRGGSSY